jgi:hypothetical protein
VNKLRNALISLTTAVMTSIVQLDNEMQKPESRERGARLAKLTNLLEMENDRARFFGLGVDYRTDRKRR